MAQEVIDLALSTEVLYAKVAKKSMLPPDKEERLIIESKNGLSLASRFLSFYPNSTRDAAAMCRRFAVYVTKFLLPNNILDHVSYDFVEEFIQRGGIVPLGASVTTKKEGYRILLIRPAKVLATATFREIEIFISALLLISTGRDDLGVNGFMYVIDLKGFSMSNAWRGSKLKLKALAPVDTCPVRVKRLVVLNKPTWVSLLWRIAKVFMPQKIQERVEVYDGGLEVLRQFVNLSETENIEDSKETSFLPESWGGVSNTTKDEFLSELKGKGNYPSFKKLMALFDFGEGKQSC